MAHLSAFAYRYRSDGLYKRDARFKMAALAGMSISTLAADPIALVLVSALMLAICWYSRLSLWQFLGETRIFILLLICIFISRSLTTPGQTLTAFSGVTVTRQGVYQGALICWRLFLIVTLSLTLSATTRTASIRRAVEWYLFFLPSSLRHRVGTMIGLLVRFIPVILIHSRDIAQAQKARGIDNRKNPVFRMVALCLPLLRRIVVSADRLALAMASRCYGDHPVTVGWQASPGDWLFLGCAGGLCLLMSLM